MSGKVGLAPCGHVGEHVTANYVRCPQCDPAPGKVTPALGTPITSFQKCPECGCEEVECFTTLIGPGWHCIANGHVWWT